MLVLSNKQLGAFRPVALKKFEDDMVVHIKTYFPEHYCGLGEPVVRNTVHYGYSKAVHHGVVSARGACLYINAMLLFGSHFDTDPQYPWAHTILRNHNIDPIMKINGLAAKMKEVFEQFSGPGASFLKLVYAQTFARESKIFANILKHKSVEALHIFKEAFPQKYRTVGETGLRHLVSLGTGHAKKYDLKVEQDVMVYLFFSFLLGHGFDRDPQFPWISQILHSRKELSANEIGQALIDASIIKLDNFYN